MRIFFAAPRAHWVRINLVQTLRSMGHEVELFEFRAWPDPQDRTWERDGKARLNERLAQAVSASLKLGELDLFLGYLYSTVVFSETIERLRSLGVPTVNFTCNNVAQFDLVAEIAPCFDLCMVPERAALAAFEAVGARVAHIGMAANPAFYRPWPGRRDVDVSFVGQCYADRADLILHLAAHGVDVRVWGAGWRTDLSMVGGLRAAISVAEDEGLPGLVAAIRERIRRRSGKASAEPGQTPARVADRTRLQPIAGHRLTTAEMIRMFSRSQISLGFAALVAGPTVGSRPTQLRLRDFEAPMSGAFYLTEYQEELEEYYKIGLEVECYRDPAELLEKVRFYLSHPEKAERIRQNAFRRAQAEHTWERRFNQLFATLWGRPRA